MNYKKIIKFCFILVSSYTFAQSEKNIVDEQGLKQGFWVEVLDSTLDHKYSIIESNYINDTLNGIYKIINNGKISYEAIYSMGEIIDFEKHYTQTGKMIRIIHRKNNLIDYELIFYSNGKIKKETSFFLINNQKLSIEKNYYSNGELRLYSEYLDGELFNKQYYFKKSGKQRMIIEYNNGRVVSVNKD